MVTMTLPDGSVSYWPAHTLTLPPAYRGGPDVLYTPQEQVDIFQRACSGYHTLAHCGWSLARRGETIEEPDWGATFA
jgi:hypothetical protein